MRYRQPNHSNLEDVCLSRWAPNIIGQRNEWASGYVTNDVRTSLIDKYYGYYDGFGAEFRLKHVGNVESGCSPYYTYLGTYTILSAYRVPWGPVIHVT